MPEITELIVKLNLDDAQIARLTEATEQLRRELKDCRSELCLKCGDYKTAYLGTCDGCRWKH